MKRHGSRPGIAFHGAWSGALLLGLFGIIGSGVAVAPGCADESATCGGEMWLTCEALQPDVCAKAKGCFAVPGRCASTCERYTEQGTCSQAPCKWDGAKCGSGCVNAESEEKCASFVSSLGVDSASIPFCNWDGAQCVSPCPSFVTNDECESDSRLHCAWIACSGTPQGPCSSYSADECPTFLGCDLNKHPIYSTQ